MLFTNAIGKHRTPRDVRRVYKNIVKKLDMPKLRLHDLRHTFAVYSLQMGVDIKSLQKHLGHHSVAFTLDQYGHVTETMRKANTDKLNEFIRRMKV